MTFADRLAPAAAKTASKTAPAAAERRRTLAEELRLALADDIVRGLITPGAGLDETELARRFGVSRTPVREAIRQLAASGLVEVRAHRGAVVARPSEERLLGMFEAMAELEALCAGLAAERMLPAERAQLEVVHEALRALIQDGDPQRYHETNEAFHAAIYAGAHNSYLAEMTHATRYRVQPFRRPSSAIWAVSPSRTSSMTASWSPSCAATAGAPPAPCASTSCWCARNTRRTPRRSR